MCCCLAPQALANNPVSIYCNDPTAISNWDPGVSIGSMVMIGDVAFIAMDDHDVQILDYSDPSSPQVVGTLPMSSESVVLRKDDTTLIISGQIGTSVFEVSDPMNPVLVQSYDYLGRILGFRDDVAYVEGESELLIYRCLGADAGSQLGTVLLRDNPEKVVVNSHIGFVACGRYLHTLDFSNPESPLVLADEFKLGLGSNISFMVQSSDYIYIGRSNLYALDVRNPLAPEIVFEDQSLSARGAIVHGDTLYIADRYYGLFEYDVEDSANPLLTGLGKAPSGALGLEVGENIALTRYGSVVSAYMTDELRSPIIDMHDSLATIRGAEEVAGIVYAETANSGIISYDVRQPDQISFWEQYEFEGYVLSLLSAGELLYVQLTSGLRVFDVSDPAHFELIGQNSLARTAGLVAVQGDYLFAGTSSFNESELIIYDISDPTNPRIVSTSEHEDYFVGLAQYGDTLYVAQHGHGVDIVDFQNPFSPRLVDTILDSRVLSVEIVGDELVISSDNLRVLSLNDPYKPVEISVLSTIDFVEIHKVINTLVYGTTLSGNDEGVNLVIFDLEDPANPIEAVRYPITGSAEGLYVYNDYIAVPYRTKLVTISTDGICKPCAIDLDKSGQLDFFDISLFLNAFSQGASSADLNSDEVVDFFDISHFLDQYESGCAMQ